MPTRLPTRRFHAVALLALAFAGGCTSSATFNIELQNASDQPVTAWLTKEGGPAEADWLSPEEIGQGDVKRPELINGVTIPAGKTGTLGPITGKFDAGSIAILRVYAGQVKFEQMLATNVGPLRIDVPLEAGTNKLRVNPKPPLAVDRQ